MSDILPDSRLQHHKTQVVRGWHPYAGWLNYEPIFCANCGQYGGHVPEESTFAFYLCDNCFEEHGPIAGLMMVPDEVFWEQVRQDQVGARQRAEEAGNPIPRIVVATR